MWEREGSLTAVLFSPCFFCPAGEDCRTATHQKLHPGVPPPWHHLCGSLFCLWHGGMWFLPRLSRPDLQPGPPRWSLLPARVSRVSDELRWETFSLPSPSPPTLVSGPTSLKPSSPGPQPFWHSEAWEIWGVGSAAVALSVECLGDSLKLREDPSSTLDLSASD